MLDIRTIRDNTTAVKLGCENKKQSARIDEILQLDEERRRAIHEGERLKSERNSTSAEIASRKKRGEDCSELIAEMKAVSARIKSIDAKRGEVEGRLGELLAWVPNMPHESVPHGASEKDNAEVCRWGEEPVFEFEPKDHIELGESLGLLRPDIGAKITGTGFPLYAGTGALLERALINFMLDRHTAAGYCEVFPPFLANEASHFGVGQLPKARDQMYFIDEDALFCIPTAEVPVTNIHRDEILAADQLPLRYCAYSACFRREAGSYGKDTKGLLRVHQFNKVELVKFVEPEGSYDELESLRADAEGILRALGLHYRVLVLCDADLSFASAKCYDIEVWAPGERKYLEVSSCSNFESFQARRMNVRYRSSPGAKPEFVHTLNGSGVATPRLMVALLESYQTARGTVKIPEVLRPYLHGLSEIGAP